MLAFTGQVVYLGLMSAVLLATLISMFSPGWRILYKEMPVAGEATINSGMFLCANQDLGTCFSSHSAVDVIVVVCLVFALLFELAAVGWAAASLFACCVKKLRKTLFYPLPAFSTAVTLFLFLVILLFALKQGGKIEFDINAKVGQGSVIGYSFFICCVALFFSLCSIGAGIWTAFFIVS